MWFIGVHASCDLGRIFFCVLRTLTRVVIYRFQHLKEQVADPEYPRPGTATGLGASTYYSTKNFQKLHKKEAKNKTKPKNGPGGGTLSFIF